jgi:hypothetical protein
MHKNPEDPAEVPGGFLTDCNQVSIAINQVMFINYYIVHINVNHVLIRLICSKLERDFFIRRPDVPPTMGCIAYYRDFCLYHHHDLEVRVNYTSR